MKKVYLLSSCVLAACLTACNNEDFLTEQSINANVNADEAVIGADLVSKGMKIVVNNDADTRLASGRWEQGDQLGLAWYNFSKNEITGTQNYTDWKNNTNWLETADNKLYANHIFTVSTNGFETQTDVYQGAYFAYWPYSKQGSISDKVVKVNDVYQTTDFETDWFNNGLQLSTQDFIQAGEAVDENNVLEKEFVMAPVVNVLRAEVAPEERIANATEDGAYLKDMVITQLQITAGGTNNTVFANTATIVPSKLPKVVRNNDGTINYQSSYDLIYAAAEAATSGTGFLTNVDTKSASLTTNISNPEYTTAEGRLVRAFTFPIQTGVTYTAQQYPTAKVTVGRLNADGSVKYVLGTFTINSTNSLGFATKLKNSLDVTKTTETASLTKLLRTGNVWQPLNFYAEADQSLNLNLDNFAVSTTSIKTVEQWNDLVNIYDALVAIKGAENVSTPTFTWAGTESFKGEIKTPKNGFEIKLKATERTPLVIEAGENGEAVVWPENLETVTNKPYITVTEGTTLNVGEIDGTVDPSTLKDVVINANLTNNGVIYAGQNASIGVKETSASDQLLINDGRIYVTYGAYVYPKENENGEIAYIVSDNNPETINKIEVLVEGGSKQQANVNTIVIEGTTLDLNAQGSSSSSDDRYEGSSSSSHEMPSLATVNVELKNASIVYTEGTNTTVKSVKAVEGKNQMIDVNMASNNDNNIYTLANSELTIDSNKTPKVDMASFTGSLSNYGKLFVNINMNVTNVFNETTGYIEVSNGKTVTYTAIYKQEGTAKGNIQKQSL